MPNSVLDILLLSHCPHQHDIPFRWRIHSTFYLYPHYSFLILIFISALPHSSPSKWKCPLCVRMRVSCCAQPLFFCCVLHYYNNKHNTTHIYTHREYCIIYNIIYIHTCIYARTWKLFGLVSTHFFLLPITKTVAHIVVGSSLIITMTIIIFCSTFALACENMLYEWAIIRRINITWLWYFQLVLVFREFDSIIHTLSPAQCYTGIGQKGRMGNCSDVYYIATTQYWMYIIFTT